jgi:hypothetical protein
VPKLDHIIFHFMPHNTKERRNTPQDLNLTLHRRAIMLYTGISFRRSIARILASLKNTPAVSRLPTSVDLRKFSSFQCRNTPTVYLKLLPKHYRFNRTNCVGHTTHTLHCWRLRSTLELSQNCHRSQTGRFLSIIKGS